MRIQLTRAVSFRAWHRLADPARTAAENVARFGWTGEPHRHHYRCQVTIAGPVDERRPMVIELGWLDQLLGDEVVARFEDKRLDRDVPELRDILPTCEALARDIYRRVSPRLPPGTSLVCVRLAEDAALFAECLGDG